jgi:hypothetical protein
MQISSSQIPPSAKNVKLGAGLAGNAIAVAIGVSTRPKQ